MEAPFLTRHSGVKDALNLAIFVILVAVGVTIINAFVFRSFSVVGPSMESTMFTGDRLIVNRIPITIANLNGNSYVPERGEIIVFKNPHYIEGQREEYIVKRVIAFPGERVTVKDGQITVFNKKHRDGFNPDLEFKNGKPGTLTSGDTDVTVSDNTLFVSGDHREGNYSLDSRNGLGLIPYYNVIGPVELRIWPLNSISRF